jgi:hypothetical protein
MPDQLGNIICDFHGMNPFKRKSQPANKKQRLLPLNTFGFAGSLPPPGSAGRGGFSQAEVKLSPATYTCIFPFGSINRTKSVDISIIGRKREKSRVFTDAGFFF